jgi:hypothetical protein
MADGQAIRRLIGEKTGFTPQHVNRLVRAKMQADLLSRDHASIAIANERKLNISKFVDDEDWAAMRGAQVGKAGAVAQPAGNRRTATARKATMPRAKPGRTVMVVYGRDDPARKAMFEFLESLDLKPRVGLRGSVRPRSRIQAFEKLSKRCSQRLSRSLFCSRLTMKSA